MATIQGFLYFDKLPSRTRRLASRYILVVPSDRWTFDLGFGVNVELYKWSDKKYRRVELPRTFVFIDSRNGTRVEYCNGQVTTNNGIGDFFPILFGKHN